MQARANLFSGAIEDTIYGMIYLLYRDFTEEQVLNAKKN